MLKTFAFVIFISSVRRGETHFTVNEHLNELGVARLIAVPLGDGRMMDHDVLLYLNSLKRQFSK